MMRLLLMVLLLAAQAWPSALSLSSSEAQRGAVVTAVATVPEGAVVTLVLPSGVAAELLDRQGQTVRWRLTVADNAPLDRRPATVALRIDGQAAAAAPLRIWTEAPRRFDVWLPVVEGGL